jgi:hypothetical protein
MATILRPTANDLTAEVATQSKEFREKLNFETLMMILCNRLRHGGTAKQGLGWRARGRGRRSGWIECSRPQIFAPTPPEPSGVASWGGPVVARH